ncbi:hypothetical protein AB4158_26220, partial [Vibrio splendidus]
VAAAMAVAAARALLKKLLRDIAKKTKDAAKKQAKSSKNKAKSQGCVTKGLESRGIRPQLGTRVKPEGIPDNWRVRSSKSKGGVKYSDPTNPRKNVRVEQGVPDHPHANSKVPHVRDMRNGRYVDKNGNPVQGGRRDPAGHIPLDEYRYTP